MDGLQELAQLNWRICMEYLDDAIAEMVSCRESLEKALENMNEVYQNTADK